VTDTGTSTRARTVATSVAALIDVVLVLVFAAVGRGSHGENVLGGLAGTAWPFLLGLLGGWAAGRLVARGAFDAGRVVPAGLLIWAGTLVIGMLARAVSGQGTAPGFIVVAALVLAVFLIGWRAVVRVRRRPRPRT
jgi:hypothetical protein